MAGNKMRWLGEITAYTLAGSAASALVGAVLGLLGNLLLTPRMGGWGTVAALGFAFLAIARELRWISFPLPQLGRQTVGMWQRIWPRAMAAVLWGVDLGLVFTTWATFSGAWLPAVVAVLVGDPAFGAALLVLYWLGRASSVWVAPVLLADAHATARTIGAIYEHHCLFRRVHLAGLSWSAVVLVVWLIRGASG